MKVLKKEVTLNGREIKALDQRLELDRFLRDEPLRALFWEEVPDPILCWKCGRETSPYDDGVAFSRECPLCRTEPFPYCCCPEEADEAARLLCDHFRGEKGGES